jgi:putative tricarboxylic transport membrane protein
LFRIRGLVKILDLPRNYLWASVLILCVIGTYATTNDINTVVIMLCAGAVGVLMKRTGFPAGPVVLGLLLGPLAESNLRRALVIDGAGGFLTNPIALIILVFAVLAFGATLYNRIRAGRKEAANKVAQADGAAANADSLENTTTKTEGK